MNSMVVLNLCLQNQGARVMEAEISLLKANEFVWIGKSVIFEELGPNVSC